ncbi:MAG: ArsR/SmtB family transcription factor [Limosilactobacillus pontis]|nr:metalloregulator ArsR/SmtB family transcription factor [Limosilactobacillus pontis]
MIKQDENKQRLFTMLANMNKGLSSDKRLEILYLLMQAPKTVEMIAQEINASTANTSRHLQVLRQSHFVKTTKRGNHIIYSLADNDIATLINLLIHIGENNLAEFRSLQEQANNDHNVEMISLVQAKKHAGNYLILDVRPQDEYSFGHVDGAMNIPYNILNKNLSKLPKDRPIIVYCRGKMCGITNQATQFLNQNGFNAVSLNNTWQEWKE